MGLTYTAKVYKLSSHFLFLSFPYDSYLIPFYVFTIHYFVSAHLIWRILQQHGSIICFHQLAEESRPKSKCESSTRDEGRPAQGD